MAVSLPFVEMKTPAFSTEDALVLDLWSDLLERKPASVSRKEFQHLYLDGRDQDFFPSAESAFSKEAWCLLGGHLLQVLSAAYGVDMLKLVICWKGFDMVLQGYESSCSEVSADAHSSPGDLSEPNSEAEEEDAALLDADVLEAEVDLGFECAAEPSPPHQDTALGDVSVPDCGFGSLGVDRVPSQLVSPDWQMGRGLRASGGPVEPAVLTPPLPAPWKLGGGGELPSLSAFLVLGRGVGSLWLTWHPCWNPIL